MKIYKDNITDRNIEFEKLVVKTQEEMKQYVISRLSNLGGKVKQGDGYVYHKGTFPVLLCAHMDTVHKELPKTLVYANGTLSSNEGIGGDDRCGIYMIFKILKKYDCHVVFLEDEEIGCVGAHKFIKTKICKNLSEKDLRYIIEFDRKGNNHAVTYDCDNPEFDKFITKEFFKKEHGTCSDISDIAPTIGIAAVNLSCGYYNEHKLEHWVNLAEMERVIVEAMKLLERTKDLKESFEYIESATARWGYSYGRYGYYGYDDYYDDYGYNTSGYYSPSRVNGKSDDVNKAFTMRKWTFRFKKENIILERTIYRSDGDEAAAYLTFFKANPNVCYSDIVTVTESM